MAGGIDVLDHVKEGLIEPDGLIDVLPAVKELHGEPVSRFVDERGAGELVRISAAATLAELGANATLTTSGGALADAAGDAASPQVRNAATVAGNLLQRPRCWYYRNAQFDCNKKGGYTCFARHGENQYHAIFSAGPCVIVHSVECGRWR